VTEAERVALASRITRGGRSTRHLTFEPAPAPNGAVPTNIALEGDCLRFSAVCETTASAPSLSYRPHLRSEARLAGHACAMGAH